MASEDGFDRARALFGNLFFNPDLVASFDVTGLRFPLVVDVETVQSVISTLRGTRVALTWDDANVAQQAPVDVASSTVGGSAIARAFRVPRARGAVLEVWAEDAGEIADVRLVSEAEARAREQEQTGVGKSPAQSIIMLAVGAVVVVAVAPAVVSSFASRKR